MNTITKVIIENFQAHKKTTVFPAKIGQLTVLTGPSDSGKTAVIRALRWALYNIPQGTDYIRAGTSTARVTVEYSSGHQVIRERTRSYNRYIIVDPTGERQTYEGFGVNVPLEVQLVTGVRPVVIADMEILVNLSEQLDGPFLGSKSVSAGTRAKALGKLAGTEEIDYAARQLGTDLYRRRQDEKGFNNVVVGLEEKIGAYDYLEEMGAWVEVAREILARLMADVELLERLEQLDADIQAISKLARDRQQVAIELQVSLGEIEPLLDKVGQDSADEGRLGKLGTGLDEVKDGLTRAQRVLDDTAGACAAAKLIAYAEQDYGSLSQLNRLARDMETNGLNWKRNIEVLEVTRNHDAAEALIDETQKTAIDMGQLDYLGNSLLGVGRMIFMANSILEHTKGQPEAERLLVQVIQDNLTLDQLRVLAGKITGVIHAREIAQKELQTTAQVNALDILIHDTKKLESLHMNLSVKFDHICYVSAMAKKSESQANSFAGQAEQSQQYYTNLLTQAGICPICGAKIVPERLKEVI